MAEGRRLGIGRVDVLGPGPDRSVIAASTTTFQFKYVVGDTPIRSGGFVWFAMRHVFQATAPQITDPSGAGFVTVQGPPGVTLELITWPGRVDSADLFLKAFPWQHPIEVRVTTGQLNPGDSVILTYGDKGGGGPGVRMQPTQEPGFAFRVYVAPSRQAPILPLAEDLIFPIVGGDVERLTLVAPSAVVQGRSVRLLLRAEDKYGNQAAAYAGEIALRSEDGHELRRLRMTPDHRGVVSTEVEPFKSSGVMRFEAGDGIRTARSNPARVDDKSGGQVYFGDIHGHSVFSDGRGTPDEFYHYAREVAALDFCALTDHDFMLTDEFWEGIQATTERFNEPGRFATIHAYEWSGMTDVGGDHNVYFRGTNTLLARCRSYYDYRNQQAYHGQEPQANHIEDLYSILLKRFPEGEVMTIPHFGGRPANPSWHEPRLERMVEIFSDHQRSHHWAYQFFQREYRIGILASSDNHTGRPGYGFLQNPFIAKGSIEIGTALVAVMADDLSREAIFDGIFNRRAYATSGDRILLHLTFGSARMGEEMSSVVPPELRVEVEGTARVKAIEVWKDATVVHKVTTDSETATLQWTDPDPPQVGATAAYWVRVVQENAEEAISSPIWWTRMNNKTSSG